MTDRELLEKAAKAAGLHGEFGSLFGEEGIIVVKRPGSRLWTGKVWNPLTDDGDALRLAVTLRIEIVFNGDGSVEVCQWRDGKRRAEVMEWGDDMPAAVRRAIVRAAAEMAENAVA